jgi:hypothetical protein
VSVLASSPQVLLVPVRRYFVNISDGTSGI